MFRHVHGEDDGRLRQGPHQPPKSVILFKILSGALESYKHNLQKHFKMSKRKREDADHDGPRDSKAISSSAGAYFTQSLKLLHRALKTSKGFERQKLGKRLTNAKTKNLLADCTRINQEIAVLKDLDLNKVGETYLKKSLGKVKVFAECEGLKDVLGGEMWKPEGDEEAQKAYRNVVSGMCNMKQVKEVVEGAVVGMYGVLGIKRPAGNAKDQKQKGGKEPRAIEKAKVIEVLHEGEDDADTEESVVDEQEDMSWEGFSDEQPNGKNGAADLGIDDQEDEEDVEYQSLEDDEIERFESLLGEPSEDEASSEEDIWSKIRASIAKDPKVPKARSISPEVAEHRDPSNDSQVSEPENNSPPPTKPKRTKAPKASSQPTHVKSSTFLPTLMGGYWSGTDSSASDLEDDPLTSIKQRKNRPGQAARRALWEKKYKDKANHIASGQGSLAEQRQAVLEARGVVSKKRGYERDGRGGRRGAGVGMSGGNSVVVGQRRNGNGRGEAAKKDDSGPLHPSWQAAKKAKTLEKTAKFEGKKVVF